MTREEAIRILASSCIPGSKQTEALETLIPELAESEDERTRKEIVEFIRSQIEDGNSVGWDRWIAYLEKQKPAEVDESTKRLNDNWMKQYFDDYKERKPAEWSEEDGEMIKMILGDLEWERRNTTVDKDIRLYDEKIAWLKSLKPHWKPSEVQLKYLLMLADYFESEGGISNAKSLRELYENLKKL